MTAGAQAASGSTCARPCFSPWFIFVGRAVLTLCRSPDGVGYACQYPTAQRPGQRSQDLIEQLAIHVNGQGLYAITDQVRPLLQHAATDEGLCTLFIRHTSASLLVQENFDDSARIDLENWLNRLVPENDSLYTHTLEGPDDMPAHIKSALTAIQVSIPFQHRELLLGTWQGIYLWEHRHHAGVRQVVVHL